jgi:hypothetical protein
MSMALRAVDHEQGPDVARLMIDAGKALDRFRILRDEEDGLVQIPGDLPSVTSAEFVRRFSVVP